MSKLRCGLSSIHTAIFRIQKGFESSVDCYQLCPSCDGPIIMGFKIWSLQLCMGRYWLDSKLSRLLKSWNNLSHVSGKLKLFIYRFLLSVNYDRS